MAQYKFVAVEGGAEKRSKLTRSIRSHAIRAGLQTAAPLPRPKAARQPLCLRDRFKSQLDSHGQIQTPRSRARPGIVSAKASIGDHETTNIQSVQRTSVASMRLPAYRIESLCAGSVDPFDSLPIHTNPEVDHLIRYFLTKFDLNLATLDRRRSWFPYAMQSAPMMHSTLAMTAVLWRAEFPALESSIRLEGMRQKGEAMREIRAWLTRAYSVGNDDKSTLMSSMATLVIVEVYDNDFGAAETHLQGVHDLYSSVGGHVSFKSEFILCKSINVADILVAAASGRQLLFPLLHGDQPSLPASVLEHARYPPLHHSIAGDSSCHHAQIFAQLRQLIQARRSSMVSPADLRVLFDVVDDSILQHLYQGCTGASNASRRSHALFLAAHVFMYVTLRQVPFKSPLLRRMCTRLQAIVGLSFSAREIWSKDTATLLWVAFVGLLGTGETAETCVEGQWFLKLFQSTVRGHLQPFPPDNGSAYETLSAFLWDEPYCRPVLAGLKRLPR
ncbi:hypothetical protein V8C42DRAFT_259626 [Trichoderma barbatum]